MHACMANEQRTYGGPRWRSATSSLRAPTAAAAWPARLAVEPVWSVAISGVTAAPARRGEHCEESGSGRREGGLGTEFELWLALRTFRRAEEVVAHPRPTEETNLAASSVNGGRIPIMGHHLASSLRARCGSQLFTVGDAQWDGGWSRRAGRSTV